MKIAFIYLFVLLSVAVNAQRTIGRAATPRVMTATSTPPVSNGAEMILLGEGDASDEKSNVTFTAYGTPTYPTSPTPPEGSQQIELNGTKYLESDASIDPGYTHTWIFHLYGGGGASNTLVTNMVSDDGFRLNVNFNDDDIYFFTGDGTTLNNAVAYNVGLPSYSYFQIAVVTTPGFATIYLDGVDVTNDYTIRTDYETSGVIRIGSIMGTPGSYLYGNIDAVQLYEWELSSTKIGNTVSTPGQEQTE